MAGKRVQKLAEGRQDHDKSLDARKPAKFLAPGVLVVGAVVVVAVATGVGSSHSTDASGGEQSVSFGSAGIVEPSGRSIDGVWKGNATLPGTGRVLPAKPNAPQAPKTGTAPKAVKAPEADKAPKTPQANKAPTAPKAAKSITYTVKAGDTLSGIAAWFHQHGYGALYEANKDVIGNNPDLIFVGQKITIANGTMTMSSGTSGR